MSKDNTIKQCVLICEPIHSDYESASAFIKLGVTPVIDMCVNWLCDNGMKEIFMFYSKSKHELQQFYNNYQTLSRLDTKLHLNYVKPEEMKSFGDVMREVQFRNIISQDFVILFADTISNLDLSKAIVNHFKKKVELKSVVLTSVVRDNSWDGKIHVTSAETGEILQMDEDNGNKFVLNQEKINLKKMNVEFRRDYAHCDIYICTVDVFKSFKENYQYATMFDFINGMLTSEVYEEKILAHTLQSHEHSFRVNKTKDFYLAYIHYISNHFYPYTLNNRTTRTHKSDDLKFVTKNFNKVIFNGTSIPRNSFISNSCYIGDKCTLGVNIEMEKSVLTHSCHVSSNSSLKNCIILQGCNIADNSKFENCLIEKVNETQQIRRFKILPKNEVQLVTEPLFEETPPPEESTFEEELQQVLSDDPQIEILNELNSIRKHHNKSLQQFTKEVIKILNPQGVKGVQTFAQQWGLIILKVHENQNLLMDSLFYSCANIPAYEKAFHIFLQCFFKYERLKDFMIQSWYSEAIKKYPESVALQKCQNFINMLKEESQSDSEQNGSEKQNGSNSNSNSDNEKDN